MSDKAILEAITDLRIETAGMKAEQRSTNQNLMKVVYALIGLAGASVGLKFIGSPPTTIIFGFVSFFAATYLLASTIHRWRHLKIQIKILQLVFSIFIYFSSIGRTLVFESGVTPSPLWFGPVIDSFFTITCLMLVIIFTKIWTNNHTGDKRIDEHGK